MPWQVYFNSVLRHGQRSFERLLEEIFCCVCRCRFKSYWAKLKRTISIENLGDYSNAETCLPMAAKSFKWMSSFTKVKVRFNLWNGRGKATLNQFILKKLFFDDAVDLVLRGEITNMPDTLAFGFEAKSLPNKTLDKYTVSIACWKKSKKITAGKTQICSRYKAF